MLPLCHIRYGNYCGRALIVFPYYLLLILRSHLLILLFSSCLIIWKLLWQGINYWEMLTNALSINYLVQQLFLETFYLKNDKTINTVDNFLYFLCYENAVKISNYSFLTISLSTYVNMTLNYFSLLFTCSFKIHINFIFPYSQKKLFFLFSSLRVTMLYFFEI